MTVVKLLWLLFAALPLVVLTWVACEYSARWAERRGRSIWWCLVPALLFDMAVVLTVWGVHEFI